MRDRIGKAKSIRDKWANTEQLHAHTSWVSDTHVKRYAPIIVDQREYCKDESQQSSARAQSLELREGYWDREAQAPRQEEDCSWNSSTRRRNHVKTW